jgi:Domain of unknown function (DUF4132)
LDHLLDAAVKGMTSAALHPFAREPSASVLDGDALRAAVSTAWRRRLPPSAVEPSLEVACAYARAKYGEGRAVPWSADGEAAAAATLTWNEAGAETRAPLVRLWIAEAGPSAAIEALVAERGLSASRAAEATALERQGPERSYVAWGIPGNWRALRAWLCVAPTPVYDAALAHADTLRRTAGLSLRCALAYLFPERSDWAADDARRALAPPPSVGAYTALLFASLADADPFFALIGAAKGRSWGGLGPPELHRALADGRMGTGLSRLRERRGEVVEALLSVRKMRRDAIAELYPWAPLAVTRAMTTLLGDAEADAPARAFLEAHPHEAMEVLAQALAGGKRRPVLSPILTSLVATHRVEAIALAARAPLPARRALVAAGAADELVSPATAKRLAASFGALRSAGLSRWLTDGASTARAAAALGEVAANDANVARLAGLARTCAATSPALAIVIVEALADAGTAACAVELARLAAKPPAASVGVRASERLRDALGLGDDDVEDLIAPRTKATARERAHQARRLEVAMVEGRRWEVAQFSRAIVAHPHLGALARGLLWGEFDDDGGLLRVFRLDGGGKAIAPERGRELVLDPRGRVGIPHPLELSPEHAAWARNHGLGGSPFDQLDRAFGPAVPRDAERRIDGPTRPVLARLASFGWARDDRSAGDGAVDYYRVIRGCEVQLTISGSAGFLWDSAASTRAARIADAEAAREVTRALAG